MVQGPGPAEAAITPPTTRGHAPGEEHSGGSLPESKRFGPEMTCITLILNSLVSHMAPSPSTRESRFNPTMCLDELDLWGSIKDHHSPTPSCSLPTLTHSLDHSRFNIRDGGTSQCSGEQGWLCRDPRRKEDEAKERAGARSLRGLQVTVIIWFLISKAPGRLFSAFSRTWRA